MARVLPAGGCPESPAASPQKLNVTPQTADMTTTGADLDAERNLSAIGGWGPAVIRGKGLVLDKIPAEWRERLKVLADDESGEHPGCITLPKLAAAAARQEAASKVHGGKIDIGGFPDHVHVALKAFDADGNGAVDTADLMNAAVLFEASKKSERRLLRLTAGLVMTIIVICGAMAGLTYAVVDGTKEVRADSAPTAEQQIVAAVGSGANKGRPIAVSMVHMNATLGAIPYMPQVWSEINSVDLKIPGYFSIKLRVNNIIQKAIAGDMVTIFQCAANTTVTLRGPVDGTLVFPDGEEAHFCGVCSTCSIANVVRDDRTADQLKRWKVDVRAYNTAMRDENTPKTTGHRARALQFEQLRQKRRGQPFCAGECMADSLMCADGCYDPSCPCY